jgi:hypothetical protein
MLNGNYSVRFSGIPIMIGWWLGREAVKNLAPTSSALFGSNRQVTGRNTPSAVGAVFFRDNFWDGHANHTFNGLNPFG